MVVDTLQSMIEITGINHLRVLFLSQVNYTGIRLKQTGVGTQTTRIPPIRDLLKDVNTRKHNKLVDYVIDSNLSKLNANCMFDFL